MVKFKDFKILYFIFILFFLFIFSSCSIIGNSSKQKIEDVDISGKGLEFTLNLNDDWINNKLISYSLDLENTGLKNIVLSPENIKLFTSEKMKGDDVLNGLDNFKSNLFKNGDLILYHDLSIDSIIDGNFEVKEDYFKDLLKSKLELNFEINYDYMTEFSNNVEIDMKKKKLNILNSISQAAPINIVNYKLLPTSENKVYEIAFYIKDNGISSNIYSKSISFSEVSLNLGTHDLNDCSIWKEENSNKIRLSESLELNKMNLNNKINSLIIVCKVDLSDFRESEVRNTIISGNLKYNYDMLFKEEIKLPKKRGEGSDW